jgi:hypothetical protein
MIHIVNGFTEFNKHATRCPGVWMDADLTFKEHHIWFMKTTRATEASFEPLKKPCVVVTVSVMAVQVPCIQDDALYGSKLWWDRKEVGRGDDI